MGFSRLSHPYSGGSQEFSAQFALGYIDPDEVGVYVEGEIDAQGDPAYRAYTWVDSETINVTDPLPNPCTVIVERTVSKDQLVINLGSSGSVTRVTLVNAFRQLMMNIHELLDGRVDQFSDIQQIQALAAQVNASAAIIDDALIAAAASQLAAAASEAAALAAEQRAQDWAEEDEDQEVEAGKFSAKHWAAKAAEFDPVGVLREANELSEFGTPAQQAAVRSNLGLGDAAVENMDAFVLPGDKATQTDAEIGSNSTKWMSPNRTKQAIWYRRDREILGYGQSWVDVTASRVEGNTYTNDTGRPILVSITKGGSTDRGFSVDGVVVGRLSDSAGNLATGTFLVPAGSTYSFGSSGSTITVWAELR